MSEILVHSRPRRLVDWINPTGAKKVHSLVDKVYKRKNLEIAWEKVNANRGSGGVDGQSLEGFAAQLDQQLDRLQSELKDDVYRPQPVRQKQIPKAGKPGEFRTLGIPDRVVQTAAKIVLEPIFEADMEPSAYGYRPKRSAQDVIRKVHKLVCGGYTDVVDADHSNRGRFRAIHHAADRAQVRSNATPVHPGRELVPRIARASAGSRTSRRE